MFSLYVNLTILLWKRFMVNTKLCILSRSENTQKCSFMADTIPGELGELLENLQKRNCKIMSKIAEFNSTTKKYKNSKMEDLGVGMRF